MRPSRSDHLAKAQRNRDFADRLKKGDPTEIGWALTALFYSALHYVHGYLVAFNVQISNHRKLREEILRNVQLVAIYNDYESLFDYSYNARYLMRNYSRVDFARAREELNQIEAHVAALCP